MRLNAGVHCAVKQISMFIRRQEDNLDGGFFAVQMPSHLEAVQPGHVYSENDDIGLAVGEQVERGLAVRSLADNFESLALVDHLAQAAPKQRMVINYEQLRFRWHGDSSLCCSPAKESRSSG